MLSNNILKLRYRCTLFAHFLHTLVYTFLREVHTLHTIRCTLVLIIEIIKRKKGESVCSLYKVCKVYTTPYKVCTKLYTNSVIKGALKKYLEG